MALPHLSAQDLKLTLEIHRKAAEKRLLSCNKAVSMLQCGFSFVAAQLLVKMTSSLQKVRDGRTGAVAARRGSNKFLFILNSGLSFLENKGNSVVNLGSLKTI